MSPDHSRLAYAVDTVGGEKFTLHVVDLATGKELLSPPIQARTDLVMPQFTMLWRGPPACRSSCIRRQAAGLYWHALPSMLLTLQLPLGDRPPCCISK